MVVLNRLVAQPRTVLAAGLIVSIDVNAFWSVTNCDASYGFSHCHHLGMFVWDYEALLTAIGPSTSLTKCNITIYIFN